LAVVQVSEKEEEMDQEALVEVWELGDQVAMVMVVLLGRGELGQ